MKRDRENTNVYVLRDKKVGITTTYTYLGIQFLGPKFELVQAYQFLINKGSGSFSIVERHCFYRHFQDMSSKMDLVDSFDPAAPYCFSIGVRG